MRVKLIHMHNEYGEDDFALIKTEDFTYVLENKIEDLEEEYEQVTPEDDRTSLDKQNYVIDKLIEQGYELVYYDLITRNYN